MNEGIKHLKSEILVRVIKAFYSDNFFENIGLIPFDMRPKGSEVNFRCCVYKERAILRTRIIADLGFAIENDDERTSLYEFAKHAIERSKPEENPLTVLESACKGCVPSRIYITDLCQGCVARPCVNTCKFKAITVTNGRAVIDPAKCKNCGMCLNVCQYRAITKLIVPCENACPVGAIAKNQNGYARIDFNKCISCGKCINACPFGAVHEKRQIIDVLQLIKQGKQVVAMLAPAIVGQLPCSVEQLHTAIKDIGFTKVYEVAQGADITAKHEAEDFKERLQADHKFMTTSCCAGYNEFVDKHLDAMKPFRSATQTPMYYTAEIAKKENPDAITVFFSPCVAKRAEAQKNPNVDYVITFEELGALIVALKIDVISCGATPFDYSSSKQGRNFAVTKGVAESVIATSENKEDIKPVVVDGLNKQTIKELQNYAKTGCCELGNLIEVMCCEGGCIGGNASINPIKMSHKKVTQYAETGKDIVETE